MVAWLDDLERVGGSMKIPLEKRDILAAYGASREAERSVDALLIGDWLDCQNYYDEERTAFFRQVIEKLQGMLGPGCSGSGYISIETIGRHLSWRRFLPSFIAKFLARKKSFFRFPAREIQFLLTTIKSFLAFLAEKAKPEVDEIVSLRLALYVCEIIIEARCHGMGEIEDQFDLKNLFRPSWLRAVKIFSDGKQAMKPG
jgi:hypothetical protein